MDEGKDQQRRSSHDHDVVGQSGIERVLARPEKLQHRAMKEKHGNGDHDPRKNRVIEAERTDPAGAFPVAAAQKPGDQRASALLHIPGRFSVYNALAALACCLGLGLELEEAAAALKTCEPVKGRMEVVPTGKDYTVLIDYAVTPDALDNMIRTVKDTAAGRVGVLFGCGGDRDRTKRPKMGRVVAELADYVIITSDNPRTEDPEAIIADILPGLEGLDTPRVVIPDRREAIRWGLEHAQPGDTLVLTGKGHETYQIVGKTKYHMDEREIIAEVLGI